MNDKIMRVYELRPNNGKSFYGKALVVIDESNNSETLLSYGTPIVKRDRKGVLVRLWDGWSVTTGRHIAAFCGLNKKEFERLPLV